MRRIGQGLVIAVTLTAAGTVRALPPGSSLAGESLRLCMLAGERTVEERFELFARGRDLAEAALAVDAKDARAHFALFCNLGRRLQASAIPHPVEIMRALRAMDDALALAPDDPDVMTAKGALLLNLPRLLGGDPHVGEAWLRRALAADPGQCAARRYLADVLLQRGAVDEARTLGGACPPTSPPLTDAASRGREGS